MNKNLENNYRDQSDNQVNMYQTFDINGSIYTGIIKTRNSSHYSVLKDVAGNTICHRVYSGTLDRHSMICELEDLVSQYNKQKDEERILSL